MIIIDANNAIAGRIGTYAAKQALLGQEIVIVNSEKAILTGDKDKILAEWKARFARGTPTRGPFYSRWPERILRRIIRGMIPYKQPKGVAAYKRVICHRGVPEEFKDKELIKLEGADVSKMKSLKFISLGELSKKLMSN